MNRSISVNKKLTAFFAIHSKSKLTMRRRTQFFFQKLHSKIPGSVFSKNLFDQNNDMNQSPSCHYVLDASIKLEDSND